MSWFSLIYLLLFITVIILGGSWNGEKSDKMGESMKVPRACRELPQVLKRCMNASRKETKKCKKLPSLSSKCQRLSESWQLLAESIKKKVSKDKFYKTTRQKNESVWLKNESTKPKNKSEQTEMHSHAESTLYDIFLSYGNLGYFQLSMLPK